MLTDLPAALEEMAFESARARASMDPDAGTVVVTTEMWFEVRASVIPRQ